MGFKWLNYFLCSTAFVHFKYSKIIERKRVNSLLQGTALMYVLVKCFSVLVTILYFVSLMSFLLKTHCMENRERIVDLNSYSFMTFHSRLGISLELVCQKIISAE